VFTLFKKLGSLVWTVQRSELRKVLLCFCLLFCICASYSILRNLKDTLVLCGSGFGAEVIPFLKVWGILPGVFAANWLFTRLSRLFTKEAVFYIVLWGFTSFFLLFSIGVYPHLKTLCISPERFDYLPKGFGGLIAMICSWPTSLFYVVSELWSVLLLAVVFWGFANDIFKIGEAKRTYGILNVGSNIAPIAAGAVAFLLTDTWAFSIPFAVDEFHGNFIKLIGTLAVCTVASTVLFWMVNRTVLKTPFRLLKTKDEALCPVTKRKKKLSLKESIRTLNRSPYLLCLGLIVLGYNISINFTDVLWKQQLKAFFSDPSLMLSHMYLISFGTGTISFAFALFFSYMVHRFGWTWTALITPVMMSLMAVGFFACYFFGSAFAGLLGALTGLSPLALTVYIGSWQNLLSKAGKYSLFDATKEVAFLPLSQDERMKGKAAIDGFGSGLGKSGSSLLYQFLLLSFGSIGASSPIIALILMGTLSAWIVSIVVLGRKFEAMTKPIPTFHDEQIVEREPVLQQV
jgi:ATP:ADP antiporter, AAA family